MTKKMFDNAIRAVKKLEAEGITVKHSSDEEGYFDRRCPNDECGFLFKILESDYVKFDVDTKLICPNCGHKEHQNVWMTEDQNGFALGMAGLHVSHVLGEAHRKDAREFNMRWTRKNIIQMKMEVKGFRSPLLIPELIAASIKTKVTCDHCECRIAYYGTGYFCPACGHRDVEKIFLIKLERIKALPSKTKNLLKDQDEDEREDFSKFLYENALEDIVTHFQTVGEDLYNSFPGAPPPSKNLFQRLDDASREWQLYTGQAFNDFLSNKELQDLKIGFQKRHLLAHCDGIVDDDYIKKTGDNKYQVGQRIVISPTKVSQLSEIVLKLHKHMKASL